MKTKFTKNNFKLVIMLLIVLVFFVIITKFRERFATEAPSIRVFTVTTETECQTKLDNQINYNHATFKDNNKCTLSKDKDPLCELSPTTTAATTT
jgi:hypothetical protein